MTRLRANPIRVVLRFVASVMMVSGILLISDAGVTLLWQEPVSAYFSERQQVKLEKALIDPPARVVRKEPLRGDALGKLVMPSIGVSEYVVEGTDDDSALWVTKRVGHDQLVLTACHPLYSAAQRIVAFARLTERRPAKVRKA